MHKKQNGQTVAQLVGITALIGVGLIAAAFVMSRPPSEKTRADVIYQSAQKLLSNWSTLNSQSNTSTMVLGNNNVLPGKTAMDLLVTGQIAVSPAQIINYKNSGIEPLSTLFKPENNNGYAILGYTTKLSGGGDTPVEVQIEGISGNLANFVKQNEKVTERNGQIIITQKAS